MNSNFMDATNWELNRETSTSWTNDIKTSIRNADEYYVYSKRSNKKV